MSAIFAVWIALIVLFLFWKFPVGIYLYIAYIFMVPYMKIHVGVTLSWNLVNTIVVLATYIYYKREHLHVDWSIMKPFFIFYFVQLFMMPLQGDTPFGFMFNAFRVSAMGTLVVPSALLVLCQSKKVNYNILKYLLLICITIACVYGLILTQTPGINPYIMVLSELNDEVYLERYFTAEDGGRLFGRISSVFDHPMTYACFLGFSFIYVFNLKENLNKWIFYSIMGLIVVNCITCGVRSVLGGLALAAAYYFYRQRNFKTVVLFSIVGLIGYAVISRIPELNAYLGSITQQEHNDVAGSTLDMRLDQLTGALTEFSNSPIFGKGYGWHSFYLAEHGSHPILLYFESLIYIVLCDLGLVGVIIWIVMVKKYFINNYKLMYDSSIVSALIVFYIAYSSITGDYGYMQFFLLFYIVAIYSCGEFKQQLSIK